MLSTGFTFGVVLLGLLCAISSDRGWSGENDATEKPVESAESLAARDEVRRLEAELEALKAEVEVDGELRAFLASLRHAPRAGAGAAPTESLPDPASFSGIYELLEWQLPQPGGEWLFAFRVDAPGDEFEGNDVNDVVFETEPEEPIPALPSD